MKRLLLLAALTLAAAAQPKVIGTTVHTYPPHLAIFRQGLHDEFLGNSDEPIQLPSVQDENESWNIYFVYSHPGTPPQPLLTPLSTITVTPHDLEGRYPREGVLTPVLPAADLQDYFWRTRGPWIGGAALIAVGLLGALLRSRLQVRRLEKRWEEVAPPASDDPLIGRRLGRYLLTEHLGQGGMASVYKALPADNPDESEQVAVKVVDPRAAGAREFAERFRREVEVSRRLIHRNIVKLVDAGKEGEYLYLVMEMVKGDTLRSQVVEQGLPPDRVSRLLEPVMEALIFAHSLGIVHRDLKPENVMLTYDKKGEVRVVVMDFGLARSHHFQTVTATGDLLGTPAYMSPEQINGHWEPSTDQYALGVMAYEMLVGSRPFESEDSIQVIMQHLQNEPVPARERKATIPRALNEVVMRMLHKDPKQRFADMKEALAAWRASRAC